MNELILTQTKIEKIGNVREALEAWNYIDMISRRARELKKQMEENLITFMNDEELSEIPITEDVKIIKTKKKITRFETDAIYDALNFTDQQRCVLPKNPAFRKTEIYKNELVCHLVYEEEEDQLQVKEINKKYLKS